MVRIIIYSVGHTRGLKCWARTYKGEGGVSGDLLRAIRAINVSGK